MFKFKLLLIYAIAVSLVYSFPADNEYRNEYSAWNNYKTDYSKQYDSPNEEARRQGIFNDNLAFIEDHNRRYQNGEVGYKLAVNDLADLSHDEYRRTRLGLLG
ncbi:unnamed protein product [Acanthoscelides obtectus]|uniref:Cathepsin propeptide inhibitor domain-containing protein n=1 Tax=Acanthoscelides obtectus TaxID=200917 RepID=A0A9P0PEZ5_ACAOB|nr:unnamed protein product [Acanthoscelides obtectus]CAK1657309.1 Crustapain [Acanthoscelides obtectus]